MRLLFDKYRDAIPYTFFGVCTTLVNIVTYWICAHFIGFDVMSSTVSAWIIAVLFAYLTNRKWVFNSKTKGFVDVIKEIILFFGCRLATGFIDWSIMFLFVKWLFLNDLIVKTCANVIVIILNYIASKFIIFHERN